MVYVEIVVQCSVLISDTHYTPTNTNIHIKDLKAGHASTLTASIYAGKYMVRMTQHKI